MADDTKDTSPEGAGDSLLAVLLGEKDDEQDGTDGEEQDEGTEGDEDEGAEGDDEEEGSEDDEEGSEDEDASDDDESDDEEGEKEGKAPKVVPADAVVFTVSDGDKEIAVNAGEAKAGYLRQADYSRKTAEVAEAVKATQAERAALDQALQDVLTAMRGEDAESTPEKLAELARTDPEGATRLKFARDARAEQRGKIEAARKELADRTTKEQLAEAEKGKAAEFGKLLEAMPELKDDAKAKVVLTRMTEAAIAVGFDAADMNRITDHRLMKLLKLASDGLRLTKKAPPKPQPKGEKIAALEPGARRPGASGKALAAKDEQFKKSRSAEDATESLLAAMESAHSKKRK